MTDSNNPDASGAVQTHLHERSSRRGFLKLIGGAGAAGTVLLAAGCDSGGGGDDMADVLLDFSSDIGVLNYAYALEQLEAAFYAEAAANPYEGISDVERTYLNALKAHEGAHRDFFAAALGDKAIPALEVDFSGIDFSSRDSVLGTAQALEDTGVAAYNGAGAYLQSSTYLTLAGKIVSVEARHAAAIRAVLTGQPRAFADLETLNSFGAVPGSGLDAALGPRAVLQVVADTGLVVTTIEAVNV